MRNRTFITTAVLAALIAAAPGANAQGRHRGNGGGGGGGGEQHAQRSPSRESGGGGGGQQSRGGERQATPRDGGQRDGGQRDGGQRDAGRAEQRGDGGRREVAPPQAQRRDDGRYRGNDGRADGRYRNDGQYRADGRYAVPRTGPVPRYRDGDRRTYVQPRRNYYVYGYPSYRYYAPYGYYGYSYYDPYYRGDFFWSFNSPGWRARSYYSGSNFDYDLGKLRLDIDQRDAEVYINGYYAGIVDDFDGRLQGLRLEPGNYEVEVTLPGFEPLDFDVRVTPGRTTTYRGSLLPERP
jgi:hypothetical protein